MYRSKQEMLRLRKAIINACLGPIRDYEHTRRHAEYDATAAEFECPDGGDEFHCHEDGENPSAVATKVYESNWHITAAEEQLLHQREGLECGSIRTILDRVDSLADAILAANRSGCESSLYEIEAFNLDWS